MLYGCHGSILPHPYGNGRPFLLEFAARATTRRLYNREDKALNEHGEIRDHLLGQFQQQMEDLAGGALTALRHTLEDPSLLVRGAALAIFAAAAGTVMWNITSAMLKLAASSREQAVLNRRWGPTRKRWKAARGKY